MLTRLLCDWFRLACFLEWAKLGAQEAFRKRIAQAGSCYIHVRVQELLRSIA